MQQKTAEAICFGGHFISVGIATAKWLKELLNGIGNLVGILGCRNCEADILFGAEIVKPCEECRDRVVVIFHHFEEIVDEDVGDVIVTGMKTTQETLH